MDTGMIVAVAGLGVAVVAAYLAWAPQRGARRDVAVEAFRQARRHLKARGSELTDAALEAHRDARSDAGVPLLTAPGWIPSQPLTLDQVRLSLREATTAEALHPARAKLSRYWPGSGDGGRPAGYSAAVEAFDQPSIWFNGRSYRLLAVQPDDVGAAERIDLTFTLARYFDGMDTGEPLAYEAAVRHLRARSHPLRGPYRRWLGDPFDLSRRGALGGISTLTVRAEHDGAYFFVHRRDPGRVAVAMNTTHVTPAGEFQPHADVLPAWTGDLNLWHNIMREYAEEFLAAPDAAGDGGTTIDYQRDEPYAQFNRALKEGRVRLRVLGIGLDPLTWKPEILTVCVWEARTFDRLFAGMAERNEEGILVVGARTGRGYRGLPFTAENVLGYAEDAATLPAGRACLALAWRWRDQLGLPLIS